MDNTTTTTSAPQRRASDPYVATCEALHDGPYCPRHGRVSATITVIATGTVQCKACRTGTGWR